MKNSSVCLPTKTRRYFHSIHLRNDCGFCSCQSIGMICKFSTDLDCSLLWFSESLKDYGKLSKSDSSLAKIFLAVLPCCLEPFLSTSTSHSFFSVFHPTCFLNQICLLSVFSNFMTSKSRPSGLPKIWISVSYGWHRSIHIFWVMPHDCQLWSRVTDVFIWGIRKYR